MKHCKMNGSCRLPFCGPPDQAEEVDENAVFDVSRLMMMMMMMMMSTRTLSSTSPGWWFSLSSSGQEVAHCYLDDRMIIYMIGKQTRERIEERETKKHKKKLSNIQGAGNSQHLWHVLDQWLHCQCGTWGKQTIIALIFYFFQAIFNI